MAEGVQYSLDFAYNGQGMEKHVSRLGTVAGRAGEKLKEMVNQKGYLFYSMKRIVSYTAIFTFYAAIGKSIHEIIQLELRLAEVNTLIDKTNQDMVASYHQVTSALLELDPHLGTAIDLTKGLYEIISAGVTDPAQAFDLLVVSSKYAKVGLTDLATASSSLTGVMKAYGFTADAMRKKSDVLFASVREGKYHTDELNAAIGKILPTASSMNVSIEEIVSALAVMTQRGLDVNEASTSLNRMLLSFLRPIDKAKARFEALGWEYGRNAFQSISLTGALGRLEEASARYGDLIPVIFRRQRALRGAFILQGDGLRALEQMYGRVTSATAGAGIVSSEFKRISGTVSMELEAFHANLMQGLAGLLKYKGAVAGVIRELSTFFRGVVENLPTILGFATAILAVKRVTKLMKSEFMFATIGQIAYTNAVRMGIAAEKAKELATLAATKATKAAAIAMGVVNAVLMAAVLAYMAVTYWINKKKKADKDAAEAARVHEEVQKDLTSKLEIMALAWERATGEVRDFGKELEEAVKAGLWDKVVKKMREVTVESGKSLSGAASLVRTQSGLIQGTFKEQWKTLKKGLKDFGQISGEELRSVMPLLMRLSEYWGWANKEQEEMSENLKKNSPEYKKALMEMSQQMQKLARDTKMAVSEMTTLTEDLALRYSEKELVAMAEALERMKGGLSALEKDQLKMIGIDADEIAKDLDKLTLATINYNAAAEISWSRQSEARIDDYARTAIASWTTIAYKEWDAKERAQGLFVGFHDLRTEDTRDHIAFANLHKDQIEKIMRYSDKLKPHQKDLFEYLEQLRKDDKKSKIDWAARYKTALNTVMDDTKKIGSKIAVLQNKYRDEEHENIMESFEREKISYLNHAYKLMDIAIASGEDQAEALMLLKIRLVEIEQWGQEAQRATHAEALQAFMKGQKDTLNAMKQPVAARLRTIEVMADKSIEMLDSLGIEEAAFYELLVKVILEHWGKIRDATEAGSDSLKEFEQFFRALGTSVSAVASDLDAFFDSIGLGESILGRMSRALMVVGEGASSFAQHLKLISESKDLAGKEGLDGVLGKIGEIGGKIGAVIAIARVALGVFKALFGGHNVWRDDVLRYRQTTSG